MIPGVLVLVYALAVARVTRLIAADKITEKPRLQLEAALWKRYRAKLERQFGGPGSLANVSNGSLDTPLPVYLLTCRWCASMYVAAVAAPLAYLWGESPWLFVPALALAFSHVTGLLAKGE
jgi:hypothetical protein